MLDVGCYSERELRKALEQAEKRRGYQKKYYRSDRGRLAQRKSQIRSILRGSGFAESEIEAIVARIHLPEDDGGPAGGDGRAAGADG